MNYSKPKHTRDADEMPYPDLTPHEHDTLADQIAEELSKKPNPTLPPLRPTPAMSTGAEQLIQTAERAITGAHDAVISHIDEMITKLQSVKESIKAKRDGAVSSLKDFVSLSAIGLDSVRELDRKVQELVKNHLS